MNSEFRIQDTLQDTLRGHNVALLLYGHGHAVSHRVTEGMDGTLTAVRQGS